MTRENILVALKNRFKNLGLSDEIMGAQSDYLLSLSPTEENIETMLGSIEPILKTFQSNLDKARKPVPQPPQPPTPPTPPAPGTPPATPPADEMPAWAKALQDKMDNLGLQTSQKTKSDNLVKKLIEAKIPEKYYGKFLNTVDYGDTFDENAVVESFKTDYTDFKQTFVNEEFAAGGEPIIAPQAQTATDAQKDIARLA